MDRDATWQGGRAQPKRHCVRWGCSSPERGTTPPLFGPCLLWPNGWMDQDTTWYEVDLGPSYIVFDGEPVPPPPKGSQEPTFLVTILSPLDSAVNHRSRFQHIDVSLHSLVNEITTIVTVTTQIRPVRKLSLT